MKKIWEIFPELVAVVRKAHFDAGMTGNGHDFEHAARVGQYAYIISEDEEIGKMAGVAGLCHNADRILQKKFHAGRREVPQNQIVDLLRKWVGDNTDYDLRMDELMPTPWSMIAYAVLDHDKPNDPLLKKPVLTVLQDADRLVNIELDLIIRCGQFQPDLPAVDFVHLLSDPTATYREPKSVFRDVASSLEWETDPRFALRNPKAIKMGKARFAALRFYIETLESQINDSGLIPYPFEPIARTEVVS